MKQGSCCIAGWDIYQERMVRLLQADGENWRLAPLNTVFRVGHLLDCSPGRRRNALRPHATEDFPLARTPAVLEHFDESATYGFLLPTCASSLRRLFGRPLTEDKFVPEGTACPSLGGVRIPRQRTSFEQDAYWKLRFRVHDSDGVEYPPLAVTCDSLLALFSSGESSSEPVFGIAEANEWLGVTPEDTEIILRIGLARGWAGPDAKWSPRRCYVQLNGIICPDDNYHIFAGPPSE